MRAALAFLILLFSACSTPALEVPADPSSHDLDVSICRDFLAAEMRLCVCDRPGAAPTDCERFLSNYFLAGHSCDAISSIRDVTSATNDCITPIDGFSCNVDRVGSTHWPSPPTACADQFRF
jgi:hypothetical protein